MRNEFDLIRRLTKKIPPKLQGLIGIGDDAGAFRSGKNTYELLTTDAIVEGVDFALSKARPEWVGRKALAVNLSDIAAMGGIPAAFVVTLGIPRNFKQRWLEKFYEGMLKLAEQYRVLCVGGDITRSPVFFASLALAGRAASQKLVLRKGAKAGDLIGVTGSLGGSILGRHFFFEPRIREAQFLKKFHPTAMIDISDGFAQDLGHILKASELEAEIFLDTIPVSSDALKLAKNRPPKALEHALSDGEDFELLFTVPPRQKKALEGKWKAAFPRVPLNWVGNILKGKPGKITWRRNGKKAAGFFLKRSGFAHF